jgi:hypothetical protein
MAIFYYLFFIISAPPMDLVTSDVAPFARPFPSSFCFIPRPAEKLNKIGEFIGEMYLRLGLRRGQQGLARPPSGDPWGCPEHPSSRQFCTILVKPINHKTSQKNRAGKFIGEFSSGNFGRGIWIGEFRSENLDRRISVGELPKRNCLE